MKTNNDIAFAAIMTLARVAKEGEAVFDAKTVVLCEELRVILAAAGVDVTASVAAATQGDLLDNLSVSQDLANRLSETYQRAGVIVG